MERILRLISSVLNAPVVLALSSDENRVALLGQFGGRAGSEQLMPSALWLPDDDMPGHAAVRSVPDLESAPALQRQLSALLPGARSYLLAPVLIGGSRVVGFLGLLDGEVRDWSAKDISQLEKFAAFTSVISEFLPLASNPEPSKSGGQTQTFDRQQAFWLAEQFCGSGFWISSTPDGTMHWSQGLYELLGMKTQTTTPSFELFCALVHREDRERFRLELDSIGIAAPHDCAFRLIRADGRLRWFESRFETIFDCEANPVQSIGVFRDVTREQEIVRLCDAMERRHESLLQLVEDPVWLTEPVAEGASFPALSSTLARARFSLKSPADWSASIHPEDVELTDSAWNTATAERLPFVVTHRLRETTGEYCWRRTIAVNLQIPEAASQYIGLSRNVHASMTLPVRTATDTLSGAQIRGARGILRWSVRELSERAGVPEATIRRCEEFDGKCPCGEPAMSRIATALEKAGIDFFFPEHGNSGVAQH